MNPCSFLLLLNWDCKYCDGAPDESAEPQRGRAFVFIFCGQQYKELRSQGCHLLLNQQGWREWPRCGEDELMVCCGGAFGREPPGDVGRGLQMLPAQRNTPAAISERIPCHFQ